MLREEVTQRLSRLESSMVSGITNLHEQLSSELSKTVAEAISAAQQNMGAGTSPTGAPFSKCSSVPSLFVY